VQTEIQEIVDAEFSAVILPTNHSAQLIWSSHAADAWLPSRALSYAEGSFETMRSCMGRVPLWPWHYARLQRTASYFGWPAAALDQLQVTIENAASAHPNAMLKLLAGNLNPARGYADVIPASIGFLLYASEAPAARELHLQLSSVIAHSETSAGLKSFARHTQLSLGRESLTPERNEWLLLDPHGNIACARSGNIYARFGERIVTPTLAHCGVHGAARAALLKHWPKLKCADIPISQLAAADELFCSNGLRGIEPVHSVCFGATQTKSFDSREATKEACDVLRTLGFAIAI
jgi:4-amino-4-deoxychorismate lyase